MTICTSWDGHGSYLSQLSDVTVVDQHSFCLGVLQTRMLSDSCDVSETKTYSEDIFRDVIKNVAFLLNGEVRTGNRQVGPDIPKRHGGIVRGRSHDR